jgi:hypothetical protein
VHPPSLCTPPPQPERLVMRGGGVGHPKMCIPPSKILGTPLPTVQCCGPGAARSYNFWLELEQ